MIYIINHFTQINSELLKRKGHLITAVNKHEKYTKLRRSTSMFYYL